ncbi:MAG: MFS transporter [Candidatus Omnitrophota bacterium]
MKFNREKTGKGFLILSWSLYDLANQFFALNVVSLYFPRWITLEKKSPEVFYGLAFGVSMFLVAVCAPFLGIVSDMRGRRRVFLIFFTLLSIVFTMSLGVSTNVFLALIFFAIANFGCQEAIIFYNALMVKVAPRGRIGFVSGLGRMFGYSGAILALYLTKPVILNMGYQATFIFTGILFLIFSLPCMIFVKEGPSKERAAMPRFLDKERLLEVFRRLRETVFLSEELKGLRDFLKASFFMLCVVNTIILFMAVYAARVFGLNESQLINLIAFSTFFAIAGSILSGVVSDYIGCRRALLGVFFLWGICVLAGSFLRSPYHWFVGALAGTSLGSTWVVFRALVIKLVPEEKIGEAFGIFNLISYLSGVIGPILWGTLLLYFSRLGEKGYRLAFLSLMLLIVIGVVFLLRIKKEEAES